MFFDDNDNYGAESAHIVPIITEIRHIPKEPDEENYDQLIEKLKDTIIMPLRNTVLFPDMTLPIAVSRKKSIDALHAAQREGRQLAVVCQIDSTKEDPQFDALFHVGTMAEIIKVLQMPDDTVNVILHGRQDVTIDTIHTTAPILRGSVTPRSYNSPAKGDKEYKALIRSIKDVTLKMLKYYENGGTELAFAIRNIDDPVYLINFIASNISFDYHNKQKMLDETDILKRGYMLHELLQKELQLVELKANIQSKTREDLSQQQREHFLQQQIKAIQQELGNDGNDAESLRERAKKMKWNDDTAAYFDKELKKLERSNQQSPDYSVQFQFLDTLLSLPWGIYSKDNFNLKRVESKLNHDHYGLEKVKDRILEHLAVLKLRGDLKAPILCLYGPPGVGKTSLGRSVAEALGRKYARISLGGLHDEAEIRGHRRTYVGALPGRIIDALLKCGTSNPVIVLDEIDKVGQDFKGDPAAALLEVLDPEQNGKFHDNFIDIDYDLTKVLFIATANNVSTISQPLLDRMELIEINGYIQEEKIEIARRHLVPKQLEVNGFDKKEVAFPKATIAAIIDGYTRESGVRELEKKISQVLRKVARKKVTDGEQYATSISVADLQTYLGPKRFDSERVESNEFAGVVTGLAWTAGGGEILFIESSLSRGKGDKLTLTGNLGDVMKESAVIALEYIKAHAESLGIDHRLFEQFNVHVHVPEGAIPKDGPSAGVTMVTSLVSSFTQRRVRQRLAMTGEITLRGKVLPVGGIKEKMLAAKRAGITDVILCKANKKDIDDINEVYLKGLNFHFVDTIKQVLDFALTTDPVADPIDLTVKE